MISIIPDRGLHFPGHTESLAWLEGRPHVGLSLVLHSDHRGRHVETHPVCQICDMILHYYYFYTNVLAPIGALGVAISVCLSVCLGLSAVFVGLSEPKILGLVLLEVKGWD